jgi:hypothetical protein
VSPRLAPFRFGHFAAEQVVGRELRRISRVFLRTASTERHTAPDMRRYSKIRASRRSRAEPSPTSSKPPAQAGAEFHFRDACHVEVDTGDELDGDSGCRDQSITADRGPQRFRPNPEPPFPGSPRSSVRDRRLRAPAPCRMPCINRGRARAECSGRSWRSGAGTRRGHEEPAWPRFGEARRTPA